MEKRIAEEMKIRRVPELLVQEQIRSPMLFGYIHKKLLLSPMYTIDEISLIMRHEMIHVKNNDLWYKLFFILICDIYWFNPLFRLMKKLAKREEVWQSCHEEHYEEMKKFVKKANLTLESRFLYESFFGNLEDPEDLNWNCIDYRGEIQIGWAFDEGVDLNLAMEAPDQYGKKVIINNSYNGEDFIDYIEELMMYMNHEELWLDFETLKADMKKAMETHDVKYIKHIYYILHDLDYFLFRYGAEDVEKSMILDQSTILKYYGVLNIYQKN